jgi:hypothetical protein
MHGKKEQSLVQSFRRRRQVSHSGGYIDTRESDCLGPVVFSCNMDLRRKGCDSFPLAGFSGDMVGQWQGGRQRTHHPGGDNLYHIA